MIDGRNALHIAFCDLSRTALPSIRRHSPAIHKKRKRKGLTGGGRAAYSFEYGSATNKNAVLQFWGLIYQLTLYLNNNPFQKLLVKPIINPVASGYCYDHPGGLERSRVVMDKVLLAEIPTVIGVDLN